MSILRWALLALALTVRPASATGCEGMAGSEQMRIELLFGRTMSGGAVVTNQVWQAFLAEIVTPRFPDGLTVLNGTGQWRNPAGRITHEPSTVVLIIAAKADNLLPRLDVIRAAYRQRFHQESVGLVMAPVCAVF